MEETSTCKFFVCNLTAEVHKQSEYIIRCVNLPSFQILQTQNKVGKMRQNLLTLTTLTGVLM